MERIVVAIGDIHGCLEEFDELLKVIQFNKEKMRLVLLGDLMDRGPDPVGCVRRVREMDVECIMGNHEEKNLRWHKHQKKLAETGKANPMKPMSEADAKANEALTDADWTWLKALPIKIDLGNNWWAVHAGCEPKYTLAKQNPSQIMRVRYVDEKGTGKALGPNMSQPEGTVYWTEQWRGPENIVYGHCVHNLIDPRHDYFPYGSSSGVHCLGIDTGCCFGGNLTAAFFKPISDRLHVEGDLDLEFVQVKAKKKYYAGYGED
jgi:bis(5'-nucleosyl)-tetraphosphatase (symmetrical)